ncbi:hypothetical protein BGZ92_005653, partial [Podila epicladia]
MESAADIQRLRDELAAQQLLVQQQSAEVARLQGLVDNHEELSPLLVPQHHHHHCNTTLPSGYTKFYGIESHEESKIWIEFATLACKTRDIATLGWRNAIILQLEGSARLWGLQYNIDNPILSGADPETIFNHFKDAFMDQYSTKEDSLYLRAEWNAVEWNSGESPNEFLQRFEFAAQRVKGLTFDEKIYQFLCVVPTFLSDFVILQKAGNWSQVKDACNIKTQQQLQRNLVHHASKKHKPKMHTPKQNHTPSSRLVTPVQASRVTFTLSLKLAAEKVIQIDEVLDLYLWIWITLLTLATTVE